MAFQRYIEKNGKKLGPYYYENIRSKDGKVKSIYLGTNPMRHPKHRIRKPLIFLIIALLIILILGSVIFFLENKSYLTKEATRREPDFDVDQILLKVLIRNGEYAEKQLRVMDIGKGVVDVSIESLGVPDILKIDSSSFSLKPGQTKVVTLNITSVLPEEKIEQQPGIYVGKLIAKSQKGTKEIPIVVEIETKNVLFDMNLNPVAIERRIKQGSDTTIEVRVFNLQSIDSESVDVDYFVKDTNGNTIITESETVVVKTQASFFKTVSIPKDLKTGTYIFASQTKFGNSIGTASYLFDVVGPETESSFIEFCKNSALCLGLSLITILFAFAMMAYFYFFIGAYLYEKICGITTIPAKRREEEEIEPEETKAGEEYPSKPMESLSGKIKDKIEAWKKELKVKEREELNIEKELQSMEGQIKKEEAYKPSRNLNEFYSILSKSKEAISGNDSEAANNFYKRANRLYAEMPVKEKKKIYSDLTQLYKDANRLMQESKKQEKLIKKLEAENAEERAKQKSRLEKEKKSGQRKKNLQNFLHRIGLYKTPEEKEQRALQKEKERQEKLMQKQELTKQKQLESQEKTKEKGDASKPGSILDEFYAILSQSKDIIKKGDFTAIEELYTSANTLYSGMSSEEKQKAYPDLTQLYSETRRMEQEFKKQKKLSKKREALERKKAKKDATKQRKAEAKQKQKEKRRKALEEKTRKKEESRLKKLEQKGLKEKTELKKSGKEMIEYGGDLPEKAEEAAEIKFERIPIKSKKLGNFYALLHAADDSFNKNDIKKAKTAYIQARNAYLSLDYTEKKQVYSELMVLYNKLLSAQI